MADFSAATAAELAAAIASANASTDAVNTITLTAAIELDAPLPALLPQDGTTLVIAGGGFTVDGKNSHAIFFAYDGDITIENVILANGNALGGSGGAGHSGGGGGMGAGGALFVNATADVTLIAVTFSGNSAEGGKGGHATASGGGGGGGGMGGDGGDGSLTDDGAGGGGGGLYAAGGAGGSESDDPGPGGTGIAAGLASGGGGGPPSGGAGGPGGGGGGGGGASPGGGGGGGGGGIGGATADSAFGAAGGDFGGGGGTGTGNLMDDVAVSGGFGGGAGGSGADFGGTVRGASGGFGGGGAGQSPSGDGEGEGGRGGFGGGDGAGGFGAGGGGGGAGFGGAVFVRGGGKLTIGAGGIADGSVTGGAGGGAGSSGSAAGSGVFLQGTGTLSFDPALGATTTVGDAIADEAGFVASGYTPPSGYTPGSWSVAVNGGGTLVLAGDNLYTGATTVAGGRLLVDGSIARSAVTVLAGAVLGGTGTVGAVKVNGGGTIAAGDSPGILTTGDLTLARRASFAVELAGPAIGTGYSEVVVKGAVVINDATLSLSTVGTFKPAAGDSFTILANDEDDEIFGTFSGLSEGGQFVATGRAFTITYSGGDGNDVVLTAIRVVINGTAGADRITATNTVFGQLPATMAADTIRGWNGNDILAGIGGDDMISGDGGRDTINGGPGNDTLNGGTERDALTGGSGDDVFVFSSRLARGDIDRITDFRVGDDMIHLSQASFAKLGPVGQLGRAHFTSGDEAHGHAAQIVYDRGEGTLTYDRNGGRDGGDILFARVTRGTMLHADDFMII